MFEPSKNNNKFHWVGKELDKLGEYTLVEAENLYIALEWNYGREQTYAVVSAEGMGDEMSAFVLKNNETGALYSFSRRLSQPVADLK
ncbi:MAG: hypothetical protein ABJC98_20655 [Bacteroidota bacterium]